MKLKSKLPLERQFSSHQKLHLFLIFMALNLIAFVKLGESFSITVSLLAVILITLLGFSIVLIKRGLYFEEDIIYKAYFLYNYVLLKKQVELQGKTSFSALKFKTRRKLAFFSAAKPDLSEEFYRYDVYLLNFNHTKKDLLISLEEEKSVNLLSQELQLITNLKEEVYSPNFS